MSTMKLSPHDRKEIDKFCRYLASKYVQVIVQSRLGEKQKTTSRPHSTLSDWVSLLLAHWKPWPRARATTALCTVLAVEGTKVLSEVLGPLTVCSYNWVNSDGLGRKAPSLHGFIGDNIAKLMPPWLSRFSRFNSYPLRESVQDNKRVGDSWVTLGCLSRRLIASKSVQFNMNVGGRSFRLLPEL